MDPTSATGNTGATRRDNSSRSSNDSGAGTSGTVPSTSGPRLSRGQRSGEALHSATNLVLPAPADAGPSASTPQFRLGKCYWEGQGVAVNKGEAVRLIRLAASTEALAQQWLKDNKDSLPLGQ